MASAEAQTIELELERPELGGMVPAENVSFEKIMKKIIAHYIRENELFVEKNQSEDVSVPHY